MKFALDTPSLYLLCFMTHLIITPSETNYKDMKPSEDLDEMALKAEVTSSRKGPTARFLGSVFKIVRFDNSACTALTSEIGACYTASECAKMNGKGFGSCALGFGVCCIVSQGCDSSSKGNNSYFIGPSTMKSLAGNCRFTIKGDANICQYRLNFERFNIAPPESEISALCLRDQFAVIGAITKVPPICGFNDGQHIIFDTNGRGDDVDLVFTGIETFDQREWKIRIIKYCCNDPHLAPRGCLQYFTGSTGTIQSFNFMTDYKSNYLALMGYSMCIRNEVGFCGICYTQCMTHDRGTFAISGDTKGRPNHNKMPSMSQASKLCEKDYLLIPCGGPTVSSTTECGADRFCGGALSSTTSTTQTGGDPVCTAQQPFVISFYTDDITQRSVNPSGFCLNYRQVPCVT